MNASPLPWPVRPAVSARRELPALEGIRGLAVTMVFVVHYAAAMGVRLDGAPAQRALLDALVQAGHAGVDVFFVLSGYLIHRMLIGRPRPFGGYLRGRLRRLYPTFLVVLALNIAMSLAVAGVSKVPGELLPALALTLANAALLPGVFDIPAIVPVAWSLSYEMAFYLALPLAIAALGLGRWTSARRVALFAAAAAATFVVCASSDSGHVRAMLFLAGMIVHELTGERATTRGLPAARRAAAALGLPVFVLALVAIATLEALSVSSHARYAVLFVPLGLLCLGAVADGGVTRAPFLHRAPRWLGTVSYSYYLIHGPITTVAGILVARAIPPGPHDALLFWALMPPVFAGTLVAAALLFATVEQPLSLTRTRRPPDIGTNPARNARETTP